MHETISSLLIYCGFCPSHAVVQETADKISMMILKLYDHEDSLKNGVSLHLQNTLTKR